MAGKLIISDVPHMIIGDYKTWDGRARVYDRDQPYGAVVGVPLLWRNERVGIVYVADLKGRKFTPDDAEALAHLASQAAIALEQHARFRRLEGMQAAATDITRY